MTLTVIRLLADERLGLTLVAGETGSERSIRWAHVIELEDPTPWLTGGELVMTNAEWLPRQTRRQREYVRRLSISGASALAVKIAHVDAVPQALIREADLQEFPVLTVAPELPFVAISRAVADLVVADDGAAMSVVAQQQNLARQALIGGVPAIVEALARALHGDVLVLDAHEDVKASAGHDCSPERVTRLLARRPQSCPRSNSARVDDEGYIISQSLGVAGNVRGYVVVATTEPLEPNHRLLVSHAATLISIEDEKPTAVRDVERRLRADLLRALLGGVLDETLTHLQYFGITSEMVVVALVVVGVSRELPVDGLLEQVLSDAGAPHLSMLQEDMIVVLLPSDVADKVGERIVATLNQGMSPRSHAGRGTAVPLVEAASTYAQALAAARNARAEGRPVVRFEELSIYNLLLGGQAAEVLEMVASSVLGPVEEYDISRNGADLVPSLDAYLTHNGQWEAAAASLGVHRHTMRHRMAKVRELLGRDIESAHVRAELWLAVRAHELLRLRG